MLNINSNKSKRKFYWLLIIFILIFIVFIIIPLVLNYFINRSNQNFLSNYFGAVIGATVSGFIALYATHQQITANRYDNFNNKINFNNYEELNNLLNEAFKETTSMIKIESSITTLIRKRKITSPNIAEYIVPKYLSFYGDKSFPKAINFHNSYIMKLQSITGSLLNMSTPIKDLHTFKNLIKNRNNNTYTIYNDIDSIFDLNKQIRNIYKNNDNNRNFNSLPKYLSNNNIHYPYLNPSNLIKKENNYLKDFKNKVRKLLKILIKMINDIKSIRDKSVRDLIKR